MNLITPNAFSSLNSGEDHKRSKLSPTREDSGKMGPSVKASLVAIKTHDALKKLSSEVTLSLIDIRRYLSQVEEENVGSAEWEAILSFLNVMNGVSSFIKREATKLSNAIEDVRGEETSDS